MTVYSGSVTDPPICKVCKMAAVAGCRNTLDYPSGGAILIHRGERLMSVECPNMRVVTLRQRLLAIDPQLLTTPHRQETPLFKRGEFDRTQENLFIRRTHWLTFLSHFKWVLGSKSSGFFVRVATDMTLLNVFLGNASLKNRLPSQRTESGELLISNSLEDLLSSPDLAVLRLGHVIHGNRAAPNVLREALLLRLALGKPTWIVEPLEQVFAPLGMACCDENVANLVSSSFVDVYLEDEALQPAYVEDEEGVTVPGTTQWDDEAVPDASEPEVEADDEARPKTSDDILFAALTERKPKQGRYQKGRRRS